MQRLKFQERLALLRQPFAELLNIFLTSGKLILGGICPLKLLFYQILFGC